jgi:hypothetical protein
MDSQGPPPGSGLQLRDLLALVVGFGLASLLIRSLWPAGGLEPNGAIITALVLMFCWLGLAMSGPVVLLIPRGADPQPEPGSEHLPDHRGHTWAELAWLVIGFYWISLTILIFSVQRSSAGLDTALLGVLPVLAALGLWWRFGRRQPGRETTPIPWTHHVAVGLLATWPIAWAALILLLKTLL